MNPKKNRITATIETRSAGRSVRWLEWTLVLDLGRTAPPAKIAGGVADSEAEADRRISDALNVLAKAVAEAYGRGIYVDRPGAVSNRPAYVGAPTAPRSGAEN